MIKVIPEQIYDIPLSRILCLKFGFCVNGKKAKINHDKMPNLKCFKKAIKLITKKTELHQTIWGLSFMPTHSPQQRKMEKENNC